MNTENKQRERTMLKTTLFGSVANLILLLIKSISGVIGHSTAMIADAVHSLSDFVTDLIVLIFIRIGNKPQDEDHHYGHGKYESFATFVIGFVLIVVGVGIFYNGAVKIVGSFKGESLTPPGQIAFWAAILSIVVKEILFRYTIVVAKKVDSNSMKANAWHHRSDSFSSIGTALGIGGAILLGPKWAILDPIAAIVVSIFIVKASIQLLLGCVGELTDKSLSVETKNEIIEIVLSFSGVLEPHNLKTRRIGNVKAIEMHIRMDGNLTLTATHATATAIETRLRQRFGNQTHIVVHVEPIK